jgi:exodeoxyribonuclease-3
MKIVSWNVNGLRAAIGKTYHAFLGDADPDILCLQETKLSEGGPLPDVGPFPYRYFHCAARRGYSGTAIFSKISPIAYLDSTAPDRLLQPQEGRVQVLDLGPFYLVNVYVPNAQSPLTRLPLRCDEWDPVFLRLLLDLSKEKDVLACGDFNVAHRPIDLARPEKNRGKAGFTNGERGGFDNYLAAGFIDVFRALHPDRSAAYSWWSIRTAARERNVGWRIDYFLASRQLMPAIACCEILSSVGGSDHAPVAIEVRV